MAITFGGTVNPDLVALPRFPPSLDLMSGTVNAADWSNFILQLAMVTNNYRESSLTLTLTGVSGTQTTTAIATLVGNLCALTIPQIQGTSTATTATLTGLTAPFIPTTNSPSQLIIITNNGADGAGLASVGSNGIITLSNGITRAGGFPIAWTASGTKGATCGTLVYRLTN